MCESVGTGVLDGPFQKLGIDEKSTLLRKYEDVAVERNGFGDPSSASFLGTFPRGGRLLFRQSVLATAKCYRQYRESDTKNKNSHAIKNAVKVLKGFGKTFSKVFPRKNKML